MGRDIVKNLIANDRASKPIKAMGDAADDAADSLDDLSVAERRAALEAEKAAVRVEKATGVLTRAEQRYGKESLQAREASIRLRAAQLDLAAISEKTAAKVDEVGDAADRADDKVEKLDRGSSRLLGSLGGLALRLGPAVAGMGAFATVTLTALPALISFGAHVALMGAKVVQFGGVVAPAAASLLPLAAGLALVKLTLTGMGPALAESVSSITGAFERAGEAAGVHAAKGVSKLAREFVKLNMPEIRAGMLTIADSVNGVVLAVGKWANSVTGQKAIAASVENISGAFAELAPDVSKLALAFLNLFGRTAGDTRAVDLLATGLQRAIGAATRFLDSLTTAKIDAAWAAIGRFAGGVQDFVSRAAGWGAAIMGAVHWWQAHADAIQHVRDVIGLVTVAVGVATGGWIPALVAGVSLLVAHWDEVTGALQRARRWLAGTSDEASTTRDVIAGLKSIVGDLSSWFSGKLLPALERAGKAILPTLRDAADQVGKALHDNKDIVGKVQGVLTVLGIVLTEAVIPALTWMFQTGLPLVTGQFTGMLTAVNKVVLPGLRLFTRALLGFFGSILDAADLAFGWMPGIGGPLHDAAKKFGVFRDQVNEALNGIKNHSVDLSINTRYHTYGTPAGTQIPDWYGVKTTKSTSASIKYRAAGGPVTKDRPYIVGERGPELFVPRTSGGIIPTQQTASMLRSPARAGGAGAGDTYVTVNVTAPNYVGSTADLQRSLVDLATQGKFDVVLRRAGVART